MKENIDLHKIAAEFENKGLTEIDEIVGVWKFAIDDLPVRLKIKVVRSLNGKYSGIANYRINGYMSIKDFDTAEDALRDALSGFLWKWNPEDKDKTELTKVEDW